MVITNVDDKMREGIIFYETSGGALLALPEKRVRGTEEPPPWWPRQLGERLLFVLDGDRFAMGGETDDGDRVEVPPFVLPPAEPARSVGLPYIRRDAKVSVSFCHRPIMDS